MTSITFKLPNTLRKELEAKAKQEGRTVSNFIRHHFEQKLAPAYDTNRKAASKGK